MTFVSITIPAMRDLVGGAEAAAALIGQQTARMRSTMDGVMVDTSDTRTADPVVAWLQESLPGLRRRLEVAVLIEAAKPTFTGGVVTFDEEAISTRTPAEATADARAVADVLAGGSGQLSDDLLARLERGAADPYFASALTRALTAEQMGRFVVAVSQSRAAMTSTVLAVDDPRLVDFDARYARFLDALGGAIGTSTRATGELAPAGDTARRWLSTITADDRDDSRAAGVGSAASLLLSHATLDTRFLLDVTTGVYDVEQGMPAGSWSAWATSESGAYAGPLAPGGARTYDPMAHLMTALGRNPEAARQFFSGGTTTARDQLVSSASGGSDGERYSTPVGQRLAYLIRDRQWPTDGADGLGQALVAASTWARGTDDAGRQSAAIAAQTVSIAGSAVGRDKPWRHWGATGGRCPPPWSTTS